MAALSQDPGERARKIVSSVKACLKGDETQAAIAVATGLSPATVNRLLNDHLENFAALLAQLGLKVVPAEFRCVDPAAYEFLTSTHARVMRDAPQLIWDREE